MAKAIDIAIPMGRKQKLQIGKEAEEAGGEEQNPMNEKEPM